MIRLSLLVSLLAGPAVAEVPADVVGRYAPPMTPVEACAVGYLQLSSDGQLLATGIAGDGGWLCAPDGEAWSCRAGDMVDGTLHLPRRDGTAPVTRMLPVPEEGVLLWEIDSPLPKEMQACGDVAAAIPGVGLPDVPPPAQVDAAALAAADGPVVGAASAVPGTFAVTGVFGVLPQDDPSVALALKTLSDPEASETMRQMAEGIVSAGCQSPMVLTPGGRMLDVAAAGGGWTLRGIADCAADGEAIACRSATQRNGTFVADPEGRASRWTLTNGEPGWQMCREDAGCGTLAACPAGLASMPVDEGMSLAEMLDEF